MPRAFTLGDHGGSVGCALLVEDHAASLPRRLGTVLLPVSFQIPLPDRGAARDAGDGPEGIRCQAMET